MTRPEPPLEGDERTMLVGWLEFHRETLATKVDGLSAEQLATRPIANSATSLLGIVRHLTEIEHTYFRRTYAGGEVPDLPFGEDPFGETPTSDFAVAATAAPDVTLSAWRSEVDEARTIIANAESLDDPGESGLPLRFWLVKTLNEYARHNGHADILRELIDGTVGE